MPLYVCNSKKGAIPEEAKAKIAADITRIHCDVTGAPPTFVHAFFFEDSDAPPLGEHTAFLFGSIRSGRTDAQKQQICAEMTASISEHSGIDAQRIAAMTTDTPAKWVMEGGDLLPEPGEEAEWLAKHNAKLAAAAN